MNKLISSTFLSCLPLSSPMFFQQMEKKPGKRREGLSISEAYKSPVIRRYVSFTTMIDSPTLPSRCASIHDIGERDIHVKQ